MSRSFWSARISTKLSEQQAHQRNKRIIPYLDLARLPLWSEEDEDPIVEKQIDDGFFVEKLGSNMMSQSNINAFHKGKDGVMDLLAQADALRLDSSVNNSFAKFDDIELM